MDQSREEVLNCVREAISDGGITVIFFVSSAPNWIVKLDRDGLSTLKE